MSYSGTYADAAIGDAHCVRIVEIDGDGKWRVRFPGSQRASAVLDSRPEAEARAREILRKGGGGEIHVHDAHGSLTKHTVVARPPLPGRRQITRHPRS
jgi:hypothetical protein